MKTGGIDGSCGTSVRHAFTLQSAAAADAAFAAWLQSLRPQAQELGVSRATFEMATRGLEPDLSLPDLVIPGRPEQAGAGPAGIRADAGGLSEGSRRSIGSPPRAASSSTNTARR